MSAESAPKHAHRRDWPALRERLTATFRAKTRAEWCAILEGTDACFAPVLSFDEAADHPHNQARSTFTTVAGVLQPAAAPRFDRTSSAATSGVREAGADTEAVLRDWGFSAEEIDGLRSGGSIR